MPRIRKLSNGCQMVAYRLSKSCLLVVRNSSVGYRITVVLLSVRCFSQPYEVRGCFLPKVGWVPAWRGSVVVAHLPLGRRGEGSCWVKNGWTLTSQPKLSFVPAPSVSVPIFFPLCFAASWILLLSHWSRCCASSLIRKGVVEKKTLLGPQKLAHNS